jgi:hypothetical protein
VHLGREGWARNISEGDFVRESNDSKGDDTVIDTTTTSLQPSKGMTETSTVEAQGTVTPALDSSDSSSSFQESVAGKPGSNERATQDASAGTSLPQHISKARDSESRDERGRDSRATSTEASTLSQTAGSDKSRKSELDPGKGLMKIMHDYSDEMQPKGRIEQKAAEEQEAAELAAAASLQARALQSCEASISVCMSA